MKTTFKIKQADFLKWYFYSGYDQDQTQTIISIGQEVRDVLISTGKYNLDVKNIFESVAHECIPISLVNYDGIWVNQPEEGEMQDLPFNWNLELIK